MANNSEIWLLSLISFGCIVFISCYTCPEQKILYPCICSARNETNEHGYPSVKANITCAGSDKLNISKTLKHLSDYIYTITVDSGIDYRYKVGFESLDVFYLSNTYVKEIEDFAFTGLRFKNIVIENAKNLERIGQYAFSDLNSFTLKGESKIGQNLPELLKALENLYTVQEIGLNNLNITSNTFDSNLFPNAMNLLTINLESNNIEYLNEMVFRPFLESNSGSKTRRVIINGNPIKFDDCNNLWIIKEKGKFSHYIKFDSDFWQLDVDDFKHCV